jgi:TPR repeat protein
MFHYCLTRYLALCAALVAGAPTQAQDISLPPANPEAVVAYNEGMRRLEARGTPHDFAAIEALFRKAASLGLPHGYYGLACTIYASQSSVPAAKERLNEAYELALYASYRNVLEAQALLINYEFSGIGTTKAKDYRVATRLLKQLYERARSPGIISGAPGTVTISSPADARRLITKALLSEPCGPVFYEEEKQLWMPDADPNARVDQPKIPAAKPEAVALYRQGTDLLYRPWQYADFSGAERLFKKAADLDLPHARFGLACLIYAAGWTDRRDEMIAHAAYAADHNVLEAKALLVWFLRHRGISLPPDLEKVGKLWRETVQLSQNPDLVSGAPGTVTFESPDEALRVIFRIANFGTCWDSWDISPKPAPR